jgi:CRISPR-associated protein (TIGR02710 family)
MTDTPVTRGLLISVGGTASPVAYSIDHHRPDKLIFFASRDSRREVETKVRPLTAHRWVDQELITTPDPQNLMRSMEALTEKLASCLSDLELSMRDLVVDYTGGTKIMSAALMLATIHQPVRYSYIGGHVRSKAGLGLVPEGAKAVLTNPNPWDVLAVELRRRLARQFNQGQFAEAANTAGEASQRVGERLRPLYLSLRDLCRAYYRWSAFDYSAAQTLLEGSSVKLRQYAQLAADTRLLGFLAQVDSDLRRLTQIGCAFQAMAKGQTPEHDDMRALILDLVVSAVRAVRLAGRPDDGVARLYSAIEKIAKIGLLAVGIDNSNVRPEQIPEPLRADYEARYRDRDSGNLRFGLLASYRVLAEIGQPMGARFLERRAALDRVLAVRNTSLMVHGWSPVKEEAFNQMLDIALEFLGIEADRLPGLPALPPG